MVNPAVVWPDAYIEALRQFVTNKAGSATQIADLMTEKFEIPFTRNMICGKVGRLGLTTADPNARPNRDTKVKRTRHQKIDIKAKPAPVLTHDEATLRCAEIEPLNLTLAELDQATQCHYIAGEDRLYCGHPSLPDLPYCLDHMALCVRPR